MIVLIVDTIPACHTCIYLVCLALYLGSPLLEVASSLMCVSILIPFESRGISLSKLPALSSHPVSKRRLIVINIIHVILTR